MSFPDSGFADAGKWLGRGLFKVLPKVLIPPMQRLQQRQFMQFPAFCTVFAGSWKTVGAGGEVIHERQFSRSLVDAVGRHMRRFPACITIMAGQCLQRREACL